MSLNLELNKKNQLPNITKREIDLKLEELLENHKNNRNEISRLTLDSVNALNISEARNNELRNQNIIQRVMGRITGKNSKLQADLDGNLVIAQYASERTLQKLAEQNLISFELIQTVNNKLDYCTLLTLGEVNKVRAYLLEFVEAYTHQITNVYSKINRVEKSSDLSLLPSLIRQYQINGIKFIDLKTEEKIGILAYKFYELYDGEWTNRELLILRTYVEDLIGDTCRVSYEQFFESIVCNDELYCEILMNRMDDAQYLDSEYTYILKNLYDYYQIKNNGTNLVTYSEGIMVLQSGLKPSELIFEVLDNMEYFKYFQPVYESEQLQYSFEIIHTEKDIRDLSIIDEFCYCVLFNEYIKIDMKNLTKEKVKLKNIKQHGEVSTERAGNNGKYIVVMDEGGFNVVVDVALNICAYKLDPEQFSTNYVMQDEKIVVYNEHERTNWYDILNRTTGTIDNEFLYHSCTYYYDCKNNRFVRIGVNGEIFTYIFDDITRTFEREYYFSSEVWESYSLAAIGNKILFYGKYENSLCSWKYGKKHHKKISHDFSYKSFEYGGNNILAFFGVDNNIYLWDFSMDCLLGILSGNSTPATEVRFFNDRNEIISLNENGEIARFRFTTLSLQTMDQCK